MGWGKGCRDFFLLAAFGAGVCQVLFTATARADDSSAAAVTTQLAASGRILLQPQDAAALVGVWEGNYVLDGGLIGDCVLILSAPSGATLQGVFEYRWAKGSARHPQSGTVTGEIAADGALHFGDWELTLSRDGGAYSFEAKEQLAGQPAKLHWRRDGVTGLTAD